VLSQDPETGETAYKEVIKTFVRETDTILHVKAGESEIETTREHPFWVEGSGFVCAESLKAGDNLRLASGGKAAVEEVWEEPLDERVQVYNFEVADFHTYFVSELGVLVHNSCYVEKYLKQLNNFSENKINHIINGSRNSNHKWEKVVPKKDWKEIKKIIVKVMTIGNESPYKSVFSKKAIINGHEVEVTYARLSDGTIKISDAWVNK
jgi:hypothetical protein